MTLVEIASLINQSGRFKLHPDQITLIVDGVQKLAFVKDCPTFKYWDATQQIYVKITFVAAGYTDCVAGDIGDTVVGGSSGTSGTLISYDNDDREWVVNVGDDDDFTAGEAITITGGTGAGTLAGTEHQENYKGPYDYPTTVPVRKMVGMTTFTDPRIFGTEVTYTSELDDYSLPWNEFNPRKFYRPHRIDVFNETLTLINEPIRNSETDYRWVYFRGPETIDDLEADDSLLLIPSKHHYNFVQACIKYYNTTTEDGEANKFKVIEPYFQEWWDELFKAYTPMGRASNRTSSGDACCESYML